MDLDNKGELEVQPNAMISLAYAQLSDAYKATSRLSSSLHHPLPSGSILYSPGNQFRYRIIGPCCRLFDREQLPWPCCRLQWRSKEPSWRRIGPRFIPDLSTKRCPSYSVELIGYGEVREPTILTLYTARFTPEQQDWWYSRHRPTLEAESVSTPNILAKTLL
jgi:hypothetical protein